MSQTESEKTKVVRAIDQLRLELVELHAMAELVGESAELALEGHVRPGLGATLERIHERISAIVEEQLAAAAE